MRHREITPADDAALAEIVRRSLEEHHLDIPGTAYFDKELDHLSRFYLAMPARRAYFVLLDDGERVGGGAGLAEFPPRAGAAELQKLYLVKAVQGQGLGYALLTLVEEKARALGYRELYLETHTNLPVAIHMYERTGFRRIPPPPSAVHGTMDTFFVKDL